MDEFEVLLRQFQPRRPRPLPEIVRPSRPRWPVWIVASGLAALVIIVAIVVRYERAPAIKRPSVVVTLGALNAHGLVSAENLDDVLTSTSRAILPDVQRPGGVLQALSKE